MTPRAGFDRIDAAERDGEGRWRLLARVRAVPEKGRANAALVALLADALLADALGVPLSAVRIEGGALSREKRVRVEGDEARLRHALDDLGSSDRARGGGR